MRCIVHKFMRKGGIAMSWAKGVEHSRGPRLMVLLLERVVVANDAARLVAVLVDQHRLVREVAQRRKVLADVQDVRVHLHAFQLELVTRYQVFEEVLQCLACLLWMGTYKM